LQALARAEQHLRHSQPHVAQINTLELAAEELRCAQDCLGEITGEVHTEDLLGAIFSTFCIGK
jgi:tRNA modification GTPase